MSCIENIFRDDITKVDKKSNCIYLLLKNDNTLLKIANFVKEKLGRVITISVIKNADFEYKLNYIFALESIVLNVEINIRGLKIKSISSILKSSMFFQDEISKKYAIKFIDKNNRKNLKENIGKKEEILLDDIAKFKYDVKDGVVKGVDIEVSKSFDIPSKDISSLSKYYYLSSNNNSLAFSLAIEKLAKIDVSRKVKFIRMIADELIRASSHLLNFSILSHILDCKTLMFEAIKAREILQDIKQIIWKSRLDCNMNIIGGVNHDINGQKRKEILQKLDIFKKIFKAFYIMVNKNEKINHTKNMAKIDKNQALVYGLTGPVARACSLDNDIRGKNPYLLYDELEFKSVSARNGDIFSRIFVRLDEVSQSIRLMEQSLYLLPDETIKAIKNFQIPKGETSIKIEAPRGELFYYIKIESSNKVSRLITRTPTNMNWQVLKEIIPGNNIKQMPLILNSFDPCVSCSLNL